MEKKHSVNEAHTEIVDCRQCNYKRISLLWKLKQLICRVRTGHSGLLAESGTHFVCDNCYKAVSLSL